MQVTPIENFEGRLRVAAAVAVAFFTAFLPFILFGGEGVWFVQLLFVVSWPYFLVATCAGFIFAKSIEKHPDAWAITASAIALATSTIYFLIVSNTLVGLFGLPVAMLAPLAFRILLPLFIRRGSNER
jgi:hypothetical protein